MKHLLLLLTLVTFVWADSFRIPSPVDYVDPKSIVGTTGDFDGDGSLDIAMTMEKGGSIWLHLGIYSYKKKLYLLEPYNTYSSTPTDIGFFVDLDGDGDTEWVDGGTVYDYSGGTSISGN